MNYPTTTSCLLISRARWLRFANSAARQLGCTATASFARIRAVERFDLSTQRMHYRLRQGLPKPTSISRSSPTTVMNTTGPDFSKASPGIPI